MKNIIISTGISTCIALGAHCQIKTTNPSVEMEVELSVNHIQKVETKIHGDKVYFSLKAKNDPKNGYYSLVKYHDDGSFESVGFKEIVPNQLNTPILYSFIDEKIPATHVRYALIEITDDSRVIKEWHYQPGSSKLEPFNAVVQADHSSPSKG